MKALTLTQPWATLVAIGAKRVETRSWRTSYRGPLAIHAAKGFPKWAQETCWGDPFDEVLRAALGDGSWKCIDPKALPLGATLATCNLVECVPADKFASLYPELSTEQEMAFGDYGEGRWAWILEDVKFFLEPIPAKGAQSLWEWPAP